MMDESERSIRASEVLSTDGATLAWRNITLEVPLKTSGGSDIESPEPSVKRILDKVSGAVVPGELLFVMGPSGSGKSTILDSLADRVKLHVSGVQTLDGKFKTANALKAAAKYVQQTDDLLGVLTVRETLEMAAALYVPDETKREDRVESVLTILGLTAHQGTQIGGVFKRGLSGGQKRRVSIGCELVASPRLIFLDEPTSGLDSATAHNVMDELRNIAKTTGMAMIITVHQPSELVFEMADTLLLISGGHTCYFGPVKGAAQYFNDMGFEKPPRTSDIEWMLDLVNCDFGDAAAVRRCVDEWPESRPARELDALLDRLNVPEDAPDKHELLERGDKMPYAVSFWQQANVLTRRGIINTLRNPAVLWLRFFLYLALAGMIGTIWLRLDKTADELENVDNAIFFVCAFMIFMSISVLPAYLEERTVLVRERANGSYSVGAYILSHTLFEIPYLLLLAFMASGVTYALVGLTSGADRFFVFTMNLFMGLFVAESVMVLISAVIPFLIVGIALAALLFGLFMAVMGIFINVDDIGWWWRWVRYVSLHFYSYSAFSVNQFRDTVWAAAPDAFPPFPNEVQGSEMYISRNLEDRQWVNFVAQGAMVVVYRLLASAWLHFFLRGKK